MVFPPFDSKNRVLPQDSAQFWGVKPAPLFWDIFLNFLGFFKKKISKPSNFFFGLAPDSAPVTVFEKYSDNFNGKLLCRLI